MKPLTARQSAILNWITAYIHARGHSPSLREIAASNGYRDASGAMVHLKALRKKGFLDWNRAQPRTLVVVRRA